MGVAGRRSVGRFRIDVGGVVVERGGVVDLSGRQRLWEWLEELEYGVDDDDD